MWSIIWHLEPSTPSIEGLISISHDLGLLDNELQSPLTELLSQIQADVSSLEGRVRSLALAMDCPIQARPRGETSDNVFPVTFTWLWQGCSATREVSSPQGQSKQSNLSLHISFYTYFCNNYLPLVAKCKYILRCIFLYDKVL